MAGAGRNARLTSAATTPASDGEAAAQTGLIWCTPCGRVPLEFDKAAKLHVRICNDGVSQVHLTWVPQDWAVPSPRLTRRAIEHGIPSVFQRPAGRRRCRFRQLQCDNSAAMSTLTAGWAVECASLQISSLRLAHASCSAMTSTDEPRQRRAALSGTRATPTPAPTTFANGIKAAQANPVPRFAAAVCGLLKKKTTDPVSAAFLLEHPDLGASNLLRGN